MFTDSIYLFILFTALQVRFISGTVSITIPNESAYNVKSAKKKVDL